MRSPDRPSTPAMVALTTVGSTFFVNKGQTSSQLQFFGGMTMASALIGIELDACEKLPDIGAQEAVVGETFFSGC